MRALVREPRFTLLRPPLERDVDIVTIYAYVAGYCLDGPPLGAQGDLARLRSRASGTSW